MKHMLFTTISYLVSQLNENSHIDIGQLDSLSAAAGKALIHYEPNRIDYTINDAELKELESLGSSSSKEVFFATLGLSIPSIVNGIIAQGKLKPGEGYSNEILVNYVIGFAALVLCIFTGILWFRETKKKKSIVESIKNKPRFSLPGREVHT